MTRLGSSLVGHANPNDTSSVQNIGNVPGKCVNCDQVLLFDSHGNGNSRMIGAGVVAFTSFVRNIKTQVVIGDALKEIYSILNVANLEKSGEDNCALCVDCCLIFAQLYGLLQAFEARRKPDGFLEASPTNAMRWTSSDRNKLAAEADNAGGVEVGVPTESENFRGELSSDLRGSMGSHENDESITADEIAVDPIPTSEELRPDGDNLFVQTVKAEPRFDEEDPLNVPSSSEPMSPSFVHSDADISSTASECSVPKIIRVQSGTRSLNKFSFEPGKRRYEIGGEGTGNYPVPSSAAIRDLSAQALAAAERLSVKPLPARSFYPCHKCGMNFTRRDNMRRHVARFHANKKPEYTCSHCPRRFYQKENLTRHLARVAAQQTRSAATSGTDSTEEMSCWEPTVKSEGT